MIVETKMPACADGFHENCNRKLSWTVEIDGVAVEQSMACNCECHDAARGDKGE